MGLVRSEIRKLTTVVTTWVLTGVGMLLVLLTAAIFTFTGEAFDGSDAHIALAVDQVGANSIIVLVVGLLLMTTEFRHGTVGRTLQITPARLQVIGAKLLAGGLYGLAFMVAGLVVVVGVLIVAALVGSTGIALGSDTLGAVWQGAAGLVLTALLGVAVGALIRSQVVALTLMLVWVFIVESLVGVAAPSVGKWLPFSALDAVFATDPSGQAAQAGLQRLDPALGLVMFLAYVVVAAGAAAALMRTRDV